MKWTQVTEVGKVRKQNEDNVLVIGPLGLFAVADGMGGHKAGEVASEMALQVLEQYVRNHVDGQPEDIMRQGVQQANGLIYETASNNLGQRGMGTTITAALLRGKQLLLAHVGDSRAYLLRKDQIRQLTVDHSLVQALYDEGVITLSQAREHPRRNVLTRALGTSPTVEVDLASLAVEKKDMLLLCTDGLSGLMEEQEIYQLCKSTKKLDKIAMALVNMAMDRGGQDNISVVLVEID